jgi:protein required for attachment to host cells
MAKTWILVAETNNARILQADSRIGPLAEFDRLDYSPAHLKIREQVYDFPESGHVSVGQAPPALERPASPRRQAFIGFIEQVADYLDQAFNQGQFSQLIIIAGPEFIDILKKKLSNRAVSVVVMQMDRSMGHHTVEEIRRHLPDHLPVLT